MKRLIPKSRQIELARPVNLFDYFFLTSIIGVGLFLSIFAFVATVHYQHEDALQKFRFNAGQLHSLISSKAARYELELEVLTKFIATNRSVTSAKQVKWLKTRVADTQFSCVSLLRVEPKTRLLWQEKELKTGPECTPFDRRNAVVDASSIRGSGEKRFAIVRVLKVDNTNETYLSVTLSNEALLPTSAESMEMMTEIALEANHMNLSEFSVTKRISLLDQKISVNYKPVSSLKEMPVGWTWSVLAAGIIITLLIGGIVFSLINRNIAIQKEVESKTLDLQEATNQAVHANQTKSRFLANVSHEVRTPLNLILGMAEVLSETNITAEQKNYIETFRRAGNHLLGVVNDVLDVASIEAGETPYEEHEMSLLDLAENVSDFISVACRIKKLSYNFDIDPNIPSRVMGDSKRLRQVLINLVNNSLKYTDRGGITLRLKLREGMADGLAQVVFEVQDTGIGIPQSEVTRIFGEFYQVDSTSTRSRSGVGLGLSIVKTYVEHLRGSIDVQSEVGAGSTFTVCLGLKPCGTETWLSEIKKSLPLQEAKKILLISANPVQSNFIRNSLSYLGHEVTILESGRAALKQLPKLKHKGYRFVIDMVGKDLGGLNLLRPAKFSPAESARTTVLCPIVHRASDPKNLEEMGITNVCYAPIKIRSFIENLRSLDREKAEQFTAVEKAKFPSMPEGIRLLIAEDDEDNRFLLQTYLGALNVEVSFATDGKSALERYKMVAPEIDLLVTDIQMPEMDGFELIHEVRTYEATKNLKPVPIVALTADAQTEQIEKVKLLGGNHYLTKPISKRNLLNLVCKYTSVAKVS